MGIGDFEDIKLTIRASDFIRSELPSCDLEVIENASENYDLKSVNNNYVLRDMNHKIGQPQTIIAEYGKAIGFSMTKKNIKKYLWQAEEIISDFYEMHRFDEGIIFGSRDLGVHRTYPSQMKMSKYEMIVWAADFTPEGAGKLFSDLRDITLPFEWKKKPPEEKYNLYVIDLDKRILKGNTRKERKFIDKNPDYQDGKPCVYVGQTILLPEKRLEKHKKKIRSSRYSEYMIGLLKEEYEERNPIIGTRDDAEAEEKKLGESLRKKGWAVWWN